MPGPGGGRHGGGGHGGGHRSAGGGFHGGGHGGFHGGGYHYRPTGGWYRRRGSGGSGCLGNLIGIVFAPIVILVILVAMIGTSFREISSGGDVRYNEEAFQDFADQQYAAEFGASSAYEDNLLITVLINDSYSNYDYIAWVGDHIAVDINYLFGDENTEFGSAMDLGILTTSYKYSLDSNLAGVMRKMAETVQSLGLASSFTCTEDHVQVSSHLTNRSELAMTESTVNDALAYFTDTTGIPVVIVVEDASDVFERSVSAVSIVVILVVVVIAVVVIVALVKRARRKEDEVDERDRTDRRYRDFDDQY